jgi:urease accessory protein
VIPASPFLAALQLGDSLFPSGAFSHSFGLEALVADGVVRDAASLRLLLEAQLREKLAVADLPALLAVHDAAEAGDEGRPVQVDRALTAVKLAREDREASARMGRRLLAECARLAPSRALSAHLAAVERGEAPGNSAVALGLATQSMGVAGPEAALVACYSFCSSAVSAAMRLLRVGHGETQAVLRSCHPAMAAAVGRARRTSWTEMVPCTPELDIAHARHERAEARLFAS